jgi:hypothetical protein
MVMRWLMIAAVCSSMAWAQVPSTSAVEINRALDARRDVAERDVALDAFVESLRTETGLPLVLDERLASLMPYGEQTPIRVIARNTPLRTTLDRVASTLGLRVVVGEESVTLVPSAALVRTGRRVTVEELRLLQTLATTAYPRTSAAHDASKVIDSVDASLASIAATGDTDFVVERRLAGVEPGSPVALSTDATLLSALDALDRDTPITWYLFGDTVVVLPKRQFIEESLNRPIAVRYGAVAVDEVIADIGERLGVVFEYDPGVLQRVPEEFRLIRFSADASAREILNRLSAVTGLVFEPGERSVKVR